MVWGEEEVMWGEGSMLSCMYCRWEECEGLC